MAHQYQCSESDCGFTVRSADRDEVVRMAREHHEQQHGETVTGEDVEERLGSVSSA